ncbi:alanine/glycine:cation symporter family protein [Cloacibacillus porcorum]|uniref:Amino acid carrier protein n=1 Tax=Cloacibacillus porcorum TaxID=1197717 RepID=A0A1B2I8E0_9BACT|nr:amino acid carrier protein [Cloacibacillus porcorum]ANZ46239.1 hypothetical protein BED41_14690 [Cloacibacillus porcorum]
MVDNLLNSIVSFLWGPPLLVLLLGTGVYFSVLTRCWQIRNFFKAFKHCFFTKDSNDNDSGNNISSYEAASVAIAGSIGAGNIGGVAGAIALGGPGVVFWLWATALVGMMTKMVEVTLAVYFREKNNEGKFIGGPTFYMEKGLGSKGFPWKIIAIVFSVGILLQMFLSPENFSVSESMYELIGVDRIWGGVIYAIACWVVIYGGLSRVAKFASLMMPFMSLTYLILGLWIIVVNYERLPEVITLIFRNAFTPTAAVGGFAGATFMITVRTGIARGLFSNEAGWGTSPMVHASARNKHPIEQGMWGMMEVFIDTMVVCTITALVILVSGEWASGAAGVTLTMRSFQHGLGGFAKYFIAIALFLFCWTTQTGWFCYHQMLIKHVFRDYPKACNFLAKAQQCTQPLYGLIMTILIVIFGVQTKYAWLVVDISSAIPTFINLFVIIFLTKKFLSVLNDFEGPKKLYGKELYDSVKID